jgi:hypothetical protein
MCLLGTGRIMRETWMGGAIQNIFHYIV